MQDSIHVETTLAAMLGNPDTTPEDSMERRDLSISDILALLLQISLPMVLILAYFVFARLKVYEDVLGNLPGGSDSVREVVLELQRQKLIAALERVKSQTRQSLHLASFEERSPSFEAGHLRDELFKSFCDVNYTALNDQRACKRQADEIYDKVLIAAQVEPSRVLKENERWIREQIQDFVKGLVADVVRIQNRTMKDFYTHYLDLSPEQLDQLDPQLKVLRENYVKAEEDTMKEAQELKLYNHIHEKLRTDLDEQNYHFLEMAWQEIRQ
jgi:hypothetical protein